MLRAAFALIALCVSLLLVASQPPTPAVTMDDIKKAWQDREKQLDVVTIRWAEQVTKVKGSLNSIQATLKDQETTNNYPSKDTIYQLDCELALSGSLYRFNQSGPAWSIVNKAFRPMVVADSDDGTKHTTCESTSTNQTYGTAYLHPTKYDSLYQRLTSTTFLFAHLRGGDGTRGGYKLDQYELSGHTLMIRTNRCIELVRKSRSRNLTQSLYLDSANGFRILQSTKRGDDGILATFEVTYDVANPTHPTGWSFVGRGSGGQQSVSAKVTGIDFRGPSFDSDFPPGTRVIDGRTANPKEFVVRDDGLEAGSVGANVGTTYDQLKALPPKSSSAIRMVVAGIALVLLFGVVIVVFLRRKGVRA